MSQKDVSLGEFLRYERELRGVTIEQVASATKVGIRTLHALEADHYSELPAKPFIRGFVNSYCRFIGLDSKELLARFDDYINSKASERPNREAGHSGYAFEKRDGEQQSRTLLLVAIFGFVVVGGVAIVFLKPSFHHQRASHVDKLRAAHGVGVESPLPNGKLGSSTSSLAQFTQGSTTSGGVSSLLPSSSQSLLVQVSGPTRVAGEIEPLITNLDEVTAISAGKEIGIENKHKESVKVNDNKATDKQLVIKEAAKGSSEEVEKGNETKELVKIADKKEIAKNDTESEEDLAETNAADPLDSGLSLKSAEIHHKVIFKVLADIWVRYKVDTRPVRKFIIRKGNSLVLRAKEEVSVEISNPKSVMFNYNSHGSKLLSSEKKHAAQQGGALYFFPSKTSAKSESPFVGGALPKTPDPSSGDRVGLATGAKEPLGN